MSFEQDITNEVRSLEYDVERLKTLESARQHLVDVRDFGAKGDTQLVYDAKCSGNAIITSATANFKATDVGKKVSLYNDSTNARIFRGATILSVDSPTQVTVDSNGASTVSTGVGVLAWGSDDTAAIQAAFDYAATLTGTDTNYSENTPTGGGYTWVLIPANNRLGNQGVYMVTNTITVRAQTVLDCTAMIVSGISDSYTRLITFEPGAHVFRLLANCFLGQGVLFGANGQRSQTVVAGFMRLWRVGTATSGSNRQIGYEFRGFGYSINQLWVKGGNRGVFLNTCGDVLVNTCFLIGCTTGWVGAGAAQIYFMNTLWDTNLTTGIQMNVCQNVHIKGGAFINNNNASATLPTFAILGNSPGSNPNANIDLEITCQNTGGNLISVAYTNDLRCRMTGSNGYLTTGNSTPVTGGVVYNTNNGGYMDIELLLSSGVAPYVSGTQYGSLRSQVAGLNEWKFYQDLRFPHNTEGVILKDRTNGNSYRLKVSGGVLGVEVA